MTICNRCGKEVESEAYGQYSAQRGFLCNSCVNLLDMTPCSECGEHFPFSEMVEWDGDMFCKKDYTEMKARADEEDREDEKKAAEEKKRDDEEGLIGEKPSGPEETKTSEEGPKEESIFKKLGRFLGGKKK
jgi:hypothetical protein